jgi:hypothetical protein
MEGSHVTPTQKLVPLMPRRCAAPDNRAAARLPSAPELLEENNFRAFIRRGRTSDNRSQQHGTHVLLGRRLAPLIQGMVTALRVHRNFAHLVYWMARSGSVARAQVRRSAVGAAPKRAVF